MKKKLALLLALCVAAGTVSMPGGIQEVQGAETRNAEEGTVDEYSYEELSSDAKGLLITKYNGNAADVTIPSAIDGDPVVAIGVDAFRGCNSLTSIKIPDSVLYIGYSESWDEISTNASGTFMDCSSLEEITMYSAITPDDSMMYETRNYSSSDGILYDAQMERLIYCPAGRKRNVEIGANVTIVDRNAFGDCANLEGFIADENNENYSSVEGILYDKAMAKLICCPQGKKGSLEIGAGVTDIERDAFSGCRSLEGFTVDANNTKYSAKDGILYDKGMVTLISCPAGKTGSLLIPEDVIYMEYNAFENCHGLKRIEIPESFNGYTRNIIGNCFDNCDKLEEIVVNENNKNFYSREGILYRKTTKRKAMLICCPARKRGNIIIPENEQGLVIEIGPCAFYGCSDITKVTAEVRIERIYSSAFRGCSNLTDITAEGRIVYIDSSAFWGCTNLANIDVKIGGRIGAYAFYNCNSLTDITLLCFYDDSNGGEEEIEIGAYAFGNCSNLKNVEMQGEIDSIEMYAFDNCGKLSSITIDSVGRIRNYAFHECTSLENFTVWSSGTIDELAFDGCGKKLNICCQKGSGAEVYARQNGITYTTITKKVTTVEVPETPIIKNIGDENFYIDIKTNRCDGLSCESSDEKVVDAWYSEYGMVQVSIQGTGTAKIIVTGEETGIYEAVQAEVTVSVNSKSEGQPGTEKKSQTITVPKSSITKTEGDATFSIGAETDGDGTLSYESSNNAVASVSADGTVTVGEAGTAQITITASETDNYNMSQKEVAITVNPKQEEQPGTELKTQTIAVKNITKTYGVKDFLLGAKASGGGKLSYTLANKKIASIDKNGKVTIKGCGVTKITIKAAAKGEYKAAKKTVTLTVVPKKLKVISAKSVKAKSITVKWKKDTKASGYIIECSTDKNFKKGVKKVTVSGNKAVSQKVTKLKTGKKYYVRVCAYTVSGKSKIKGAYTKVKKPVKVKK